MSDTRLGAGGKGKSMHHFTTVLQMLCVDHSGPRDLRGTAERNPRV